MPMPSEISLGTGRTTTSLLHLHILWIYLLSFLGLQCLNRQREYIHLQRCTWSVSPSEVNIFTLMVQALEAEEAKQADPEEEVLEGGGGDRNRLGAPSEVNIFTLTVQTLEAEEAKQAYPKVHRELTRHRPHHHLPLAPPPPLDLLA
ncbi:hypothetical protein ACLB2K_008602 [Fragaria x ananassa]